MGRELNIIKSIHAVNVREDRQHPLRYDNELTIIKNNHAVNVPTNRQFPLRYEHEVGSEGVRYVCSGLFSLLMAIWYEGTRDEFRYLLR